MVLDEGHLIEFDTPEHLLEVRATFVVKLSHSFLQHQIVRLPKKLSFPPV